MTKRLRVACVGLGYFSQFHLDAWQRLAEISDIAAVDRDASLAAKTGLSAYTDVPAMLDDFRPDIVDLITPPETHLGLIEQCLNHDIRAIICQKPFCGGLADAREAVKLSERSGIPIVVHENFRFQPWYRTMKQAMTEGMIGDPLQLTFRLRPGDGQGPDAYLERQPYFQKMPRFLVHETAIHFIDTFRYLLGEPDNVYADLRRLNPAIKGEDAGYLLFSYANGVRALFDGNRLLDHAANNTRCTMGECLLEGSRGALTLDGNGQVSYRQAGATEERVLLQAGSWKGFGGDCVFRLQQHVCSALLTGSPLENLARDYLLNQQWEEAVYRSADSGRTETADRS